MKEFKEKELKEIKELEKLTIKELEEKEKDLRQKFTICQEEFRVKKNSIELALKIKREIDIYEKKGFQGLFKHHIIWKGYLEEMEEEGEIDMPF